ncbi:hypothetical protein HDU76_004359 [Blyttiomyces sp. JEL0837]|nr:hypothetical protein HDU76_004359 [Blyttiomyces sp. JEL0837]
METPQQTSLPIYHNIRKTFQENSLNIPMKDYAAIEHLIRKGKKNLELIQDPSLTSMSVQGGLDAVERLGGRKSHKVVLRELV